MIALIDSISAGLQYVNVAFGVFRFNLKFKLEHNAQIIYLEHYLNSLFSIIYDPATRDSDISAGSIIWIESLNVIPDFVYNIIEGRTTPFIFNTAETATKEFYLDNVSEQHLYSTYIIWIPTAIPFSNPAVRAIVDFFNLAGRTYSIQTY